MVGFVMLWFKSNFSFLPSTTNYGHSYCLLRFIAVSLNHLSFRNDHSVFYCQFPIPISHPSIQPSPHPYSHPYPHHYLNSSITFSLSLCNETFGKSVVVFLFFFCCWGTEFNRAIRLLLFAMIITSSFAKSLEIYMLGIALVATYRSIFSYF